MQPNLPFERADLDRRGEPGRHGGGRVVGGVRLGPDAHRQDRAAASGLHGNQEGTRRAEAIDQFGKRVPLDQARRPDRHDLVHYLGGWTGQPDVPEMGKSPPRNGLILPARVLSEQDRADAAGHLQQASVQFRQHICRPNRR